MSILIPFFASLFAGILSAWGVGGGTLLLLVMTLLLGVPQQTAQTINLLFFLPCATVALLYHRKNGYLQKQLLRTAIPIGLLTAVLSSLLIHTADSTWLRRGFGVFLLLSAVTLLRSTKRQSDF